MRVTFAYKNVFNLAPSICTPRTYTTMLDERFKQEQCEARALIKKAYRSTSRKRQRSSSRRSLARSCPALL